MVNECFINNNIMYTSCAINKLRGTLKKNKSTRTDGHYVSDSASKRTDF